MPNERGEGPIKDKAGGPRTRLHVYDSARSAAQDIAAEIVVEADSGRLKVLGVATGSSPVNVYSALAATGSQTLSSLTLFALDEYVGLPPGHPQSYRTAVIREIAEPLGIPSNHVQLPAESHPEQYEPSIRDAGGIDIQLLGIGRNGHIGFNEPGSAFDSRTRLTQLQDSTRAANARFFGSIEEVPRHSVTQGIATILEARRLIVLAFGAEKGAATAAAILGPLTETVPASALRLHANVTWVLDSACAATIFPA